MTTKEKKHIFLGIIFLVLVIAIFVLSYRLQSPPTPVVGAPENSPRIDAIREGLNKK